MDSGALIAATNRADPSHHLVARVLARPEFQLVVPVLCIAEACYMVAERRGPQMEAQFLERCGFLDIRCPEPEEWRRIAEIASTYVGFGFGGTDASVLSLAERLETDVILTLDERHFRAVRPSHVPSLRLLRDFA